MTIAAGDRHRSAGGEQLYCASHTFLLLGFISLPFSFLLALHFTLLELLNCPYFSPWVFSFPSFPPHLTRAEGPESSCMVLSCQLGLNKDSTFWHPTWAMRG